MSRKNREKRHVVVAKCNSFSMAVSIIAALLVLGVAVHVIESYWR